ncbi:MAG: cyclic nucleotide-binding domain-containing protein [Deltaproteobacteria bacterium]|jgi:SAM-dependent methyltransferase|nr:cyclic nucleotide-binding domain-containing protein [Deltaproteobacteria bacterium]
MSKQGSPLISLKSLIQGLQDIARSEYYTKGQEIVTSGSESDCLYYVEKGAVEVSTSVGDTRISVALIGAESFFGEIGFLDGRSRVRDIRAAEDTLIKIFNYQSVRKLKAENPQLYGDLITHLAYSICERFRRILEESEPLTTYAASLSTGHRTFHESKPIPEWFLNTPEWSFLNRTTEGLKAAFFDLSHQVQQEKGMEAPEVLDDKCRRILDEFNGQLEYFESRSGGKVEEFVWGYVFKEIFPYCMRSRFAERAYYKPRGYAGDYGLMEMIYNQEPDGDGKFGKLIDSWFINTSAAKAVRGRRELLSNLLERYAGEKQQDDAPFRIMNLACGSNRELFDFLSRFKKTEFIEAVCVDADLEALEYTNTHVNTFAHRAAIRLVNDNLVRWALGSNKQQYGQFDVIYSAGLADYLNSKLFVALISRCYEHLKPGGRLIIGNFTRSNPNRVFMDHLVDWKLIYRDKSDLQELFAGSPFGRDIEVKVEQEQVNLFAVATKEDRQH